MAKPAELAEHEPAYRINGFGRRVSSEREKARIKAWHDKRQRAEERERRQRKEHDDAVAKATEAARERYEQTATTSVLGVRVRPDLRIVDR